MDGILDDMSRSTAAARLTYEDLLKLPDDDKRHELIDGVHYVMSSPVLRHQRVVSRLGLSIGNYVNATGCGEVFFVAVDVVFERERVREYWILDAERNTVRVHLLGPAGYGEGVELSAAAGDVLTTDLLPGWSLALSALFA